MSNTVKNYETLPKWDTCAQKVVYIKLFSSPYLQTIEYYLFYNSLSQISPQRVNFTVWLSIRNGESCKIKIPKDFLPKS